MRRHQDIKVVLRGTMKPEPVPSEREGERVRWREYVRETARERKRKRESKRVGEILEVTTGWQY